MTANEAAALYVLAAALRELAVGLPDGSKLAVEFARQARTLELFAGGSSPGLWGGATMQTFVRDRYDEYKAGLGEAVECCRRPRSCTPRSLSGFPTTSPSRSRS